MAEPSPFSRPPFRKDRPKANKARTAAIVAGGTGLAYGGLKLGQAADQVRRTAAVAEETARHTAAITGAIRSPLKALRKKVFKMSSKSVRTDSHTFAEKPKRENAAAVMGVSSALTGGLLGGLPAALSRASKLRGVLKGAGKGAALGGLLGTGSALIGSKVLGEPKKDDGAAYAKRGAVGGLIGGAVLGGAGVLALRKVRTNLPLVGSPVRELLKSSKTFRPARWVRKANLPAAVGIGAGIGGATGAFQGADEGSGVDTLRAVKRPKQFSARGLLVRFEARLTGKLPADRYRKKIEDDDLQRRDANLGRGAVAGALAGLVLKSARFSPLKRAGLGALAGAGGVAAVRAATSRSKDYYGERTRGAKAAEKIPALAGLGAAGVLAAKRLRLFSTRNLRRSGIIRFDTMPGQRAAETKTRYAKYGARTGRLVGDATSALRGVTPTDRAGNPQTREWDKPWFHKAVGGGIVAAGSGVGIGALLKNKKVMAGAAAGVAGLARNQNLRKRAASGIEAVAGRIAKVIRPK